MSGLKQLVVVGGGQMGAALSSGLLSSRFVSAVDLALVERRVELHQGLAAAFPGVSVLETPCPAKAAVLAVKPVDVEAAVTSLRGLGIERVLSVVAGVRTETLESLLPEKTAVIRAMPNTPALIGAGASAFALGASAGETDAVFAIDVLSSVGTVVRVPEHLMDAVTGLSGSGPAYVFLVVEALIEAGVLAGLDRASATELSLHTLLGAARLLEESDDGPEALRARVTSPGGTTAAGLQVLEQRAVRGAILDAVMAATRRSAELSSPDH